MLRKGDVKMIKKFLKEGMSKSAIARKLGISRETVRRYALKPDGYIPVIDKTPIETTVDEYLPHIAKMLETAETQKVHIPTTVIFQDIQAMGYQGSLRWLQQMMQRYELRQRAKDEELLRGMICYTKLGDTEIGPTLLRYNHLYRVICGAI